MRIVIITKMGIPCYFSHMLKKHNNIITNLNTENIPIDNFYLDCNSIIYDTIKDIPYLNNIDFERKLILSVCNKIEYYISVINPIELAFIAFDGVAPVAKLEQQRSRRYKSWLQKKITAEINSEISELDLINEWDTSNITPGTEFMKSLTNKIKEYFEDLVSKLKYRVKNIIISCSDDNGEGEHKIYLNIRCNIPYHTNSTTVVYGLDADLIMLALNHADIIKKIYLFRETPYFIKNINKNLNPNELYLFDISNFATLIISDIINFDINIDTDVASIFESNDNTTIISMYKNVLFDYVFICFLLGNDFLPHFPSINIRTNGIDKLISAYKHLFCYRSKSTNIENLTNNKKIIWKNFREYIKYLSEFEVLYLRDEIEDRNKYEKYILSKVHSHTKEYSFQLIPSKERDIEKYINPYVDGWKTRYYKMLFDINIDDNRRREICVNYLEGIEFTFKYYNNGCPDWRWKYNYHYPPLLEDLLKYIPYFNVEFIPENAINKNNPISEYTQLCYVLPRNSLNLLPIPIMNSLIQKYDYWHNEYYELKWTYCKYFWESHVIMPEIDIADLEIFIQIKADDIGW